PKNLDQAVVSVNLKQNSAFTVLRTNVSLTEKMEHLKAALALVPGPQKLGFDYFITTTPLDEFTLFFLRGLSKEPTALHVYDDNTLVLGDVRAVEDFLKDKRERTLLTKVDNTKPMGQMGGFPGQMGQMGFMGQMGSFMGQMGFMGGQMGQMGFMGQMGG